jgi:predicted nucleic acid-binding protein
MYLDTSILLKLLVTEPDTDFFQDALQGSYLSSSELVATELWSALLAKERSRAISSRHRQAAWAIFNDQVRDRYIVLHPLSSVPAEKKQIMSWSDATPQFHSELLTRSTRLLAI